jgi:hypothetical protein
VEEEPLGPSNFTFQKGNRRRRGGRGLARRRRAAAGGCLPLLLCRGGRAPVIHFFRTRICSLVGGVEDAPTSTNATAGYAVSASAHQRLTWGLPRSRTWRGWGTKGYKNWGCTTAFVGGMMGVCRKKIIYAASRGAMGICSKKKSVTAFYSVNNLILARYRILAVIFQFWVVWGIC